MLGLLRRCELEVRALFFGSADFANSGRPEEMSTAYHAKYFAHELTRQGGVGVDRISRSLFDASVDLNPHQIEAAIFALRNPLAQGVILADEVGLGKTIEAGLVLCQLWAERKQRLLVICPASLRKQWAFELMEKFNLNALVLDSKSLRQALKAGNPNPFESDAVIIVSMHFASQQAALIGQVPWNLAVIDEAHKLRNAYRESNRIGQSIRRALGDCRKILLTATPLQNSLLELYGLATLIDERIFGDPASFRSRYASAGSDIDELRERLRPFCVRTLRKDVLEYVRFTGRKLITRPFKPTETEHKLYEDISSYLQRPDCYALPKGQKHLITMIVRKVLASSPQAVAGTLDMMRERLVRLREEWRKKTGIADFLFQYEKLDDDLLDELLEDAEDEAVESGMETSPEQAENSDAPKLDIARLDAEIAELERYSQWARSIGIDTKTRSLLKALEIGFAEMAKNGAPAKSIIFTESRRTQEFIKSFLEANGYAGKVVSFNGTNKDTETAAIYNRWAEANRENGRATGSFAVDVRTAIIEEFRDRATIMIGTEAAAEGLNLQFCSLVINFDLPWNPQRIEQRIGRCHRYGQKHDVVVINFLNERNEADCRVYELLTQKFKLFEGVFGVSDEVLGIIESGIDFERRILEIYQSCRSPVEIEAAFRALQSDLEDKIAFRMAQTRKMLLEHFDADVHERLKGSLTGTQEQLDRFSRIFWTLTKFILEGFAKFADAALQFELTHQPLPEIKLGQYHLITKKQNEVIGEFLYRLGHPLGEYVLEKGKTIETPIANVRFDISNHPTRIVLLEKLKGQSGWLTLRHLAIDSCEREEYLLFSGVSDKGQDIDQETSEKFFQCRADLISANFAISASCRLRLDSDAKRHVEAMLAKSLELNSRNFQETREQLEKWADDQVREVERELEQTKEQIKTLERQSRQAPTVQEQHELQQKIAEMEKKKRQQRQRIFAVEDEIKEKRDQLISALERRLAQRSSVETLFTIRWELV